MYGLAELHKRKRKQKKGARNCALLHCLAIGKATESIPGTIG